MAYIGELPFMFDTTWDLMRVVDFLHARWVWPLRPADPRCLVIGMGRSWGVSLPRPGLPRPGLPRPGLPRPAPPLPAPPCPAPPCPALAWPGLAWPAALPCTMGCRTSSTFFFFSAVASHPRTPRPRSPGPDVDDRHDRPTQMPSDRGGPIVGADAGCGMSPHIPASRPGVPAPMWTADAAAKPAGRSPMCAGLLSRY